MTEAPDLLSAVHAQLNLFLGSIGLLALVLAIFSLFTWFMQKRKKFKADLQPELGLRNIIGGLVLILISFALVNTLLGLPGMDSTQLSGYEAEGFHLLEWIFASSSLGLVSTMIFIASGFFYILSALNLNLAKVGRLLLILGFLFPGLQIVRFSLELGDPSYIFTGLYGLLGFAGFFFVVGFILLLISWLTEHFTKRIKLWEKYKWNALHLVLGSVVLLIAAPFMRMHAGAGEFGRAVFAAVFYSWALLTVLAPFFSWLKPWSLAVKLEQALRK